MRTSSRSGIVQNSITYRVLSGSFVLGWLLEPPSLSRVVDGSHAVQALRHGKRGVLALFSRMSGPLLRAEDNSLVLGLLVNAYSLVRTWYRHSVPGRFVSWWNHVE